jgi:Protein of unknown function, DUF488
LIKSDKTDHMAMHKGSALKKLRKSVAAHKKQAVPTNPGPRRTIESRPRIHLMAPPQNRAIHPALVLTIGHSSRPLPSFLTVLQAHQVALVVDVRKMPRSRKNPQFNLETLPQALHEQGIDYVHVPGFGGLRRGERNSPNTGWKNLSFQAYADYMLSPEFENSLQGLLERASRQRAVLMCAEALPWRCHRSLIADALVARGTPVEHILSESRTEPHALRPWAHIEGTRLTYPP